MPTLSISLVELSPVIGDLIHQLSGTEGRWVLHDELTAALLADRRFAEHLAARAASKADRKRPEWYAAAAIAWFSRQFTASTLPGADRFEREKAAGTWAYRRAWGPPPPAPGIEDPRPAEAELLAGRCKFCGASHSGVRCDPAQPALPVVYECVSGTVITSVEEWAVAFGDRRKLHWKDGGSAKECARSWMATAPRVPPEFAAMLESHEAWQQFEPCTLVPEHVTRLDDYGAGRHHDLVVFGRAGGNRALLCVEAKAGEDFGPLIAGRLEQAIRHSKVPLRANHLAEAVFGRPVYEYDARLRDLRYQLLHALAGTAIEAAKHHVPRAALVIHFFPSQRKTVEDSVEELDAFVKEATAGDVSNVPEGRLVPVRLHGAGTVPQGAEVFVGWVRSRGIGTDRPETDVLP